jgi:hypothetical protein
MIEFIQLVIVILLYFLPSCLSHDSKNFAQILALNLLLGWTIIGWIVALIWSLAPKK